MSVVRAFLAPLAVAGLAAGALSLWAQENEPKPTKKVIPEYPAILRKAGVSGTVRLKVAIAQDGAVKSVEVLGGGAIFADAAAKAVKEWHYPAAGREHTASVAVEFECCSTVKTTP
jgi:TonB family protein